MAEETIYLCNFRVSVDGDWLCLRELSDVQLEMQPEPMVIEDGELGVASQTRMTAGRFSTSSAWCHLAFLCLHMSSMKWFEYWWGRSLEESIHSVPSMFQGWKNCSDFLILNFNDGSCDTLLNILKTWASDEIDHTLVVRCKFDLQLCIWWLSSYSL